MTAAGPSGDGSGGPRRWRSLARLGRSDGALRLLPAAAFLATVTVVVPLEPVVVPCMLVNRGGRRLWWAALLVVPGVLAGAAVGYAVGRFLFGSVGRWAVGALGWRDAYGEFKGLFRDGFRPARSPGPSRVDRYRQIGRAATPLPGIPRSGSGPTSELNTAPRRPLRQPGARQRQRWSPSPGQADKLGSP